LDFLVRIWTFQGVTGLERRKKSYARPSAAIHPASICRFTAPRAFEGRRVSIHVRHEAIIADILVSSKILSSKRGCGGAA
jgi:hypothetical protein